MGQRSAGGWGGGRLDGDVPLHLTHPAFHLLAEIVIPAPIPLDLCTVLAAPQLMPPPVVRLTGSPVPRTAGQSSALDGPLIPATLTPPASEMHGFVGFGESWQQSWELRIRVRGAMVGGVGP